MKSAGRLEYDLERLVDAISPVEGVVAIILFGSRARGDYDESSDYDLLTIFKDDEIMWKNHRALYENVSKLGLFTQVLTRTIEEFKEKTEPTFLQNILNQGVLLYTRYPFTSPANCQGLKPMVIVTYNMARLDQKTKMKVDYRLFGKKGRAETSTGAVQRRGGTKIGDSVLLIPPSELHAIIDLLDSFGVSFRTSLVYEAENQAQRTLLTPPTTMSHAP